jgi:hypothetical protein
LKIAHFLHYLSPALYNLGNEFEWLSNGLEACGRLWKLSINLRGSNKNKEVAWPDNPPKYLSCHLYMLPIGWLSFLQKFHTFKSIIFPTKLIVTKIHSLIFTITSHADGAVERRGEEQCGYHMYACIRIIKHTGDANENEVDFGAGGDLVRSFTHTYANRDSNKGVGWPRFATCEVCLLFVCTLFLCIYVNI